MEQPKPTKEQVREYMQRRQAERRQAERKPPHDAQQIRQEVGWAQVPRERRKQERRDEG